MVDNSNLFQKVILNNKVIVPNRLVVPPITLFASGDEGEITQEEREYLSKRAKGYGLYILGASAVGQEGLNSRGQPKAINEKDIPSLAERAKIIKDQGTLAICQIVDGGISVSKKLTYEDILRIIKDFAKGTELCIRAGYDGIELHGANNCLMQQFFSGYYNKRNDDWGGSIEKRMRFPLEVIDACIKIRDKYNKPEFIIGYRLSPEEPFENGITMTETLQLVKELVKKPIQYIHISQKNYFQETRRGEGKGIPRLELIHKITKGKVALIGFGIGRII